MAFPASPRVAALRDMKAAGVSAVPEFEWMEVERLPGIRGSGSISRETKEPEFPRMTMEAFVQQAAEDLSKWPFVGAGMSELVRRECIEDGYKAVFHHPEHGWAEGHPLLLDQLINLIASWQRT